MEFTKQFREARRVSTPLIAVRTFDTTSTVSAIGESLKDRAKTPLLLWDCMNGIRPLNPIAKQVLAELLGDQPPEATMPPAEALRVASNLGNTADAILFFANAHLHWTDTGVIQAIWNLRDGFKANGNMLVCLIAPGSNVPSELVNDVLVLDEPLPDAKRLTAIVQETFQSGTKKTGPDAETLAKSLDALIGLPAFPAEQSTAMCLDIKTGKIDIPELWERKRQIISQTPGLSVWQGTEKLSDIGGLANVKLFCEKVVTGNESPKTIIFIDEIEKAFAGTGTDMSGVKTELTGSMLTWMQDREIDGMIFIGLPGVSKSNLAKALGGSHGIPVINFDLAGMQSSLVGSSGANLRAAQKTVDAISGGRILAIATCNSINALPPELRRRFNLGIFFFDAPSAEERAAIWSIYRKKYSIPDKEATPQDQGWTGAEIKECCKKAYRLNMTLAEAATYIVPVTKSASEQIKTLRQSASSKYLSASRPGVYNYAETENISVTSRRIREEN